MASNNNTTREKPLLVIAGLGCETSTFSPARTSSIAAFHPQRGDAVLQANPFLHAGQPLRSAADWRGILTGHALPGGIVTSDVFEQLSGEIVEGLIEIQRVEGPVDGVWFEIHGAMCVEGVDDAEAELLRRIRSVVGPEALVSASMDLHGNVSWDLAHQVDLITCYRTAPHVDVLETRERAARNLVDLALRRRRQQRQDLVRPVKAWIPLPILLPGEQTSTRLEPAKHIYAAVPDVAAEEGIIDAAIWVGYAWADEPRCRAVVVVTGWDEKAVSRGSEKLARLIWDAHRDFHFVAPTGSFAECLDTAFASSARPYFVSDSGDNPTAGGAGDVTWGLTQLLARSEVRQDSGPRVIYASIPGPAAVQTAVEAGIGATISVTAGAEVDDWHSGPVKLSGRVHSIRHGDRHAGTEVVIQVGSVYAIVTKLRKPYHKEHDFTALDLHPRDGKGADVVVVKIGYLEPELYDLAADWMLALTPGGVDQDLLRLGHKRIARPMWPFDREMSEPDLSARIVPASNEKLE